MKNKKIIIGLTISGVLLFLTGCDQIQQQVNSHFLTNNTRESNTENTNVKTHTLLADAQSGDLDSAEKQGLIKMREEEKLAHDVYVTLYEKWGQNTFNNISKSEQVHTDTIKYLLDKYQIDDPVKDATVGVFTDPEMQNLYNTLITQGGKSLNDALVVGATIEDLDIKDLQDLLSQTDNEDITIAYKNLLRGSRNHMRAFIRILERNGGTYTPQYIDESTYQEIIIGTPERGNRINAQQQKQGFGKGRARGGHRGGGQDGGGGYL